ncbi:MULTISPECIES: trimeric intracellular cation channel family protein [Ramlibacter]|uniref:Trimeric intracellular cation channel family protein n=1 Tax=Ramlibacter aquaticus TaxID=2780094 RepID=A0ABR9SGV2_9BURK|nr:MULTISPECIES: trimeric intracellular cation channel family protein [Ramlibacter]MBE7941104.1 trimeric intracellular cation channel family protein [Ramlibacter aquaticus]
MIPPSPVTLSAALGVVEFAATVAFAVSGLLAAANKRLDAVGVSVVAGVTAFGGGTLRDVLLDRRPFYWVEHAGWLWGLLLVCAGAMVLLRTRHFAVTRRALLWPDALGLGLFTANGAQLALDQGLPAVVCVLMGVITSVFGGVLRDVLCNDVPAAFSDHQPYAICSFIGGWVLLGMHAAGAPLLGALLATTVVTAALRLIAVRLDLALPPWNAGDER